LRRGNARPRIRFSTPTPSSHHQALQTTMIRRLSVPAAVSTLLSALNVFAAGVTVQSFNSMAQFQASPLYT